MTSFTGVEYNCYGSHAGRQSRPTTHFTKRHQRKEGWENFGGLRVSNLVPLLCTPVCYPLHYAPSPVAHEQPTLDAPPNLACASLIQFKRSDISSPTVAVAGSASSCNSGDAESKLWVSICLSSVPRSLAVSNMPQLYPWVRGRSSPFPLLMVSFEVGRWMVAVSTLIWSC